MEYHFSTPLKGNISLSSNFNENKVLQKDKSLYKFIWVQNGQSDTGSRPRYYDIGARRDHSADSVAPHRI